MVDKGIENVLREMNIAIEASTDRYIYDDRRVPRVTEILSAMLHEEYLMRWANSLGFKHKSYRSTLAEAADKGTYSHDAVEKYILEGSIPDYNKLPFMAKDVVFNAFNSFLTWWEIISSNPYEVLAVEKRMACEWFGGTLDLLIKIDGKVWLVDFKTSNHPSYKHFLQMGAYIHMLRKEGIIVEGVIILMLDKDNVSFKEKILDLSVAESLEFMKECEETFMSLVYAYYRRTDIELKYSDIFGGK